MRSRQTENPRSTINLYAQLTPRLAAQPSRFSLPNKFDRDITKKAKLIWDDDLPHKIRGATVNDPELSVTVEEGSQPHRVVLNVPAGYQYKSGARYVTVQTDDAVAPSLKIPVTFARTGRPSVTRSRPRPGIRMTPGKQPAARTPPGASAQEPDKPAKPGVEKPPAEGKKPSGEK